MEQAGPDWSELFSARDRIHRRYREVWDIPLIKRRATLFERSLKDDMTILDVGAGLRGAKEEIERLGLRITYKSMDVDKTNSHDYYDIDTIHERFDAILLFEVIEHLSLEDGLAMFKKLNSLAKEQGIIIVSTPNIFNPARYMRDSSHRTFYGYDELCGLLNMAGFEIRDVYRSYNDAFQRYILKVYLFNFLFRFLSIDYAYSIFVVGQKGKGT